MGKLKHYAAINEVMKNQSGNKVKLSEPETIQACGKQTYVFVVIKTICRPFPVTRIKSHFTWIRPISWMSKVRNMTQLVHW